MYMPANMSCPCVCLVWNDNFCIQACSKWLAFHIVTW